jgi:hypothetical protein
VWFDLIAALPIGEYAAVALLAFFGLKSIKDAWELPSNSSKDSNESCEQLGELVEAEELVKEKVTIPFDGLKTNCADKIRFI